MMLFCDCKTDEERSNFFLSGRAVETGVVAPAVSNFLAMAYHKCAQLKKENEELRASLEAAEKNLSCCQSEREEAAALFLSVKTKLLAEHRAQQDKVGQVMKRLQLIIEEPEKTVSNSHAIREMLRQATLALKEAK